MYNRLVSNEMMIGSRSSWLAMRIMEAVVFLFLMVLIPPMFRHSGSFQAEVMDFLFLSIFGVLMLGGFSHAHQNVYGFIDDGGIRYNRYFNWKSIKWNEIESVSRGPMGTVLINVGRYKFFNRRLIFMRDTVLFGKQRNFVSFDDLRSTWIKAQQLRAETSTPGLIKS
jgi:hypothetical protein